MIIHFLHYLKLCETMSVASYQRGNLNPIINYRAKNKWWMGIVENLTNHFNKISMIYRLVTV